MKEDASAAKRFMKFRNDHAKKSTDDLVKDYESKGGKVKKGPTEPMSDALRYKKPTKAATVNVAALKDPVAVSSARRKKETNHIIKKLGGASKIASWRPDHHLLTGKGAFVEDVTVEGKTFRGGDYKSNMAKRLLKAAQKTKRDQSELKRTVAEGEDSTPLRHVKTYTNEKTGHGAKVYRDRDWDEYRVKHFKNGSHQKDADYHTSDREDAHDQAKYWTGPDHEKKTQKEEVEQLDEIGDTKAGRAALGKVIKRNKARGADGFGFDHHAPGLTDKDHNDAFKRSKTILKARDKIEDNSPMGRAPKVHDLKHMKHDGEVYDHTQTSGKIKDGDVMHLHGNRSAIMFKAWPTMVHGDSEHLHSFTGGADKAPSRYKDSVKTAKSVVGVKEDIDSIDETSGMKLRRYIDASDKEDRLAKKAKRHGEKAADRSGDLYLSAIDKLRKSSQAADSRLREGKTWKAAPGDTYAAKKLLRDRIKNSTQAKKDAESKRKIEEKALEKGYHLWDTSDGTHYPEGGVHQSFHKATAAVRKHDYYNGPHGRKKVDNALAVGYHDGEHFWSVDMNGKKGRRLTEGWPEVRSLNKKKRPSKTKAKIEPTGIR